ncbi:MAG: DUF177 domain-containing protein [Pontixanthobacter sp.]
MSASELSLLVKPKAIAEVPYVIEANEAQRDALARRFELSEVRSLRADIVLTPEGAVIKADGTLKAAWLQQCAVSGEDFSVKINEALHFRFVPAAAEVPGEEVELAEDDLDEIDYDGDVFDLGEAVAQSLGLAINPFATGPNADKIREEKGIAAEGEQDGPLAEMLKALKKD